jgi:hypothetical protein
MAKHQPRGIRNNNPGNIERGKDRWLGMAADQSGDPRFLVFDTPESGIRAIMRVLINYQERHNIHTLRDAINRWAPAGENNSNAYAQHCARLTGFDPDEPLDFLDEYVCTQVARAIVRHENGAPESFGRGDWYPEDVYQRAAVMAGFEPKAKPLAKSRTVAGAAIAAVGAVAGVVAAPEAAGSLPITADDVVTVATAVAPFLGSSVMAVLSPITTLAGVALTIYARWDDSKRKIR